MDEKVKIAISQWMSLAYDDLRSARSVFKEDPPITKNACFLAQQCSEKALKAFVVFTDQHLQKTHDLVKIVKSCMKFDSSFSVLIEVVEPLTDYAVKTRYPDDYRIVPDREAKEAIAKAEEVMVFIEKKLKAYL